MEKKICSYETLFAVSGNLGEEDCKALVEKFVNLINDNASDVEVNEWGKRRFAYPINYVTEGYYVLVSFIYRTYRHHECDTTLRKRLAESCR